LTHVISSLSVYIKVTDNHNDAATKSCI